MTAPIALGQVIVGHVTEYKAREIIKAINEHLVAKGQQQKPAG